MMSVFRLDPHEFIGPALFIILIMDLQSFVLREELLLSPIVPLINIILFVLLLTTVVRVPLLWSFVIALTGYLVVVLIQVMIVEFSFGYLTADQARVDLMKGYKLQAISGILGIGMSRVFYIFGGGFTFEFEQLRIKKEKTMVSLVIMGVLALSAVLLNVNKSYLDAVFIPLVVIFFIYYSAGKEKHSL